VTLRTVFASSGHAGYHPIPPTPVLLHLMLVVTAGDQAPRLHEKGVLQDAHVIAFHRIHPDMTHHGTLAHHGAHLRRRQLNRRRS
jgi:hypothetical protein